MKKFLSFFSSLKIFIVASSLIIISLIYATFTNKIEDVVNSLFFIFLFVFIALNIIFCITRRFLEKHYDVKFIAVHFGMVLVIFGAFLSFKNKIYGDLKLWEGEISNVITNDKGVVHQLPFAIKLINFDIVYYKKPKLFVSINGKDYECVKGIKIKDEVIYEIKECFNNAVAVDNLKYVNVTSFYTNPAVLLSFEKDGKKNDIMIFLKKKNSDKVPLKLKLVDGYVKDYISDIEILYNEERYYKRVSINKPVKFMGYKIYQTDFDVSSLRGEASGLMVKKDIFVNIVFIGYAFLLFGVILWIV